MGGACSAYGGENNYVRRSGGGHQRERDHLEDLGIVGRILLKLILEK